MSTATDFRIDKIGIAYTISWTARVIDPGNKCAPRRFRKRVGYDAAAKFARKHGLPVPIKA